MKWSRLRDGYGETLSMIHLNQSADPSEPERVSFPPFNFIEKRERTFNGDVFRDGLAHAKLIIAGNVDA
jgi:hypothetical protein